MFEDSKGWLFMILLGILVGIGYTAHHLTAIDTANAMLQESKTKLVGMNEALFLRRKSWSEVESLSLRVREQMENNKALVQAREILETRYRAVDGDLKYSIQAMKTAVEKKRTEPATESRDITLTNGKLLRGAKFRKMDESGISLIHADGIGTYAPDLLPADLQDTYDLGSNALLPQLEELQKKLHNSTQATTVDNNPKSTGLSKGQASMQIAIEAATLRVKKEEEKVLEIDKEIKDAEGKRAPTFSLRTRRDIAEGVAGQARNELKKLQLEIERLKASEKKPSK